MARWQKGQSGNPNGRPKSGQSWGEIIKTTTNMTPEELAEAVGGKTTELGRAILKFPKGIPIKRLLAARLVTALMFDPTPGLINALMDREEGKVKDVLDVELRPTLRIRAKRD